MFDVMFVSSGQFLDYSMQLFEQGLRVSACEASGRLSLLAFFQSPATKTLCRSALMSDCTF